MSGDSATTAETGTESPGVLDVVRSQLPAAATSRAAELWQRIERVLIYAGDWLNPILVKETRQALKSFQFLITFVLVLVACWVVTIAGVAIIGPSIFYASSGGGLLVCYFSILAFPLVVVVPYTAFRSLASEREDNTYDLLSITTLKPRQIISGKLGSSVVQMAVYFSAIAPCIAFTYLLRGVDVPTLVVLLLYAFVGSLGLSMIGILLATLSRQRFGQVFVSVALVSFLLGTLFYGCVIGYAIIQFGYSMFGNNEFWIVTAGLATFYLTSFALAYYAASGMISFSTENRSTPLRVCMLVQQAAWLGWMSYVWMTAEYELEVLLVFATFAAMYWFAMGAMLTSERAGMSQRVKRRLPKSFLGRVFLSWLNPGPATGYMFMVANVTAGVLICLLLMTVANRFIRPAAGWPGEAEMYYLMFIGWGYLVAYLGLGMLIIRLLRRIAVVTMLAGALIHLLVVLAGSGIPTVIQLMSVDLRYESYTRLQITNPVWSLIHLANGGILSDGNMLLTVVTGAAICILLLNLPALISELQRVRIAPPVRVVEDEAELHPAPAPGPTNPWDDASGS